MSASDQSPPLPPVRNQPATYVQTGVVVADHRLVGLSEAAAILGVTRQRVDQLRKKGAMPEPVAVLRATPVWSASDIERYAESRRTKPGPTPEVRHCACCPNGGDPSQTSTGVDAVPDASRSLPTAQAEAPDA